MPLIDRFRHNLSALVLWCAFLGLYLGGAVLLVIGLVFAARTWWALIHQHAGWWAVSTKTAELLVLAVGFLLILVIPFLQRQATDGTKLWRAGRRSGMKGRAPAAE